MRYFSIDLLVFNPPILGYIRFSFSLKPMDDSKDKKDCEENREELSSVQRNTPSPSIVNGKKSKKDSLKEKMRIKNAQNAGNKTGNGVNQFKAESVNQKQRGYSPSKSEQKQHSQSNIHTDNQKALQFLNKITYRPPYIIMMQNNLVVGNFGHATVVFKRPVLQGQVFLEFKVKQDHKRDREITHESSVRFGLCINNFNVAFPIGREESIAYKSSDGSIYYKGQRIHKGEPYGIGDTISIYVSMTPPYKHADVNQISHESKVLFFKNGALIFCFEELKQTFYCLSLSLYNYSRVQILPNKDSITYCGVIYNHYYNTLKQKIIYKDLVEKGIFKI